MGTPLTATALAKKILIIDDDPDILQIVDCILSIKGFEVRTHVTGMNVLPEIKSFHPDLILLDIMLPGKSGIEVCTEVKKDYNIPIIFFSAHAKEDLKYSEYLAQGFIHKPFELEELINPINAAIETATA